VHTGKHIPVTVYGTLLFNAGDACRFDASDGHMELFKTTKKYDGGLGREMHGFPSSAELPV